MCLPVARLHWQLILSAQAVLTIACAVEIKARMRHVGASRSGKVSTVNSSDIVNSCRDQACKGRMRHMVVQPMESLL